MAKQRIKVTVRLAPAQHAAIANDARAMGMTLNDYIVTCMRAEHTDTENMAQLRALLADQTRSQVAAIDSGFGELVDALDERNKQTIEAAEASNEKHLEEIKRILQGFVGWARDSLEPKSKGGVK